MKSRRLGAISDEEEEQAEDNNYNFTDIKFKNPLADLDDEDIYISDENIKYDKNQKVDPNEKMEGELSDD